MGSQVEESLYYGEHVDIVTRKWVDYVQNIDTNVFGNSQVYVTFRGTGIIRLTGKGFEFESDIIRNHNKRFAEIKVFEGKLPPETSIQIRAPKSKSKIVVRRVKISPCNLT